MAADNALGFLAELAKMKAAGAAVTYDVDSDSSDDNKRKKKVKKSKKGKKKKVKKDFKSSKSSKSKSSKASKASKSSKSSKRKSISSSKRISKKNTSTSTGTGNTADNALGFLAELAQMKASGAAVTYDVDSDSSDDNIKRKKKKKKGKKKKKKNKKKAPIIEEEFEEKTPEPPANLTPLEKRKFLLKYARKKLEKRKKARNAIVKAKELKKLTSSGSSVANYGKNFVANFTQKLKAEQADIRKKIQSNLNYSVDDDEKKKKKKDIHNPLGLDLVGVLGGSIASSAAKEARNAALNRAPGRLNDLTISVVDNVNIYERKKVVMSDKQTMTDYSMFLTYLTDEYGDDITINMSVISGLVESQLKIGYPRELWELESDTLSPEPSPSKAIRDRNRIEQMRLERIAEQKEKRRIEREKEKAKRKNILHMNRKNASKLIKSGDFLDNFRKKSKWVERTLGLNSEFMDDDYDHDNDNIGGDTSSDDDLDDDDDEKYVDLDDKQSNVKRKKRKKKRKKKKKNLKYLKFRKVFRFGELAGRPVGNINFSNLNRDWFCGTYFIGGNRYSTDNNGCIAIWNTMLNTYPEYLLRTTNMITSSLFHPSNPFLILGSTISGQILLWDLRSNNNNKPQDRTNFSGGHSSPVFTMKFLPKMKTKNKDKLNKNKKKDKNADKDVRHILSVSNDGKLCIFRSDQLSSKPINQSILKASDDQSSARQIELITTCFDYSYRDHGNIILGSDEGYIYKAEIFSQQQSSSDQILSIKESIAAHYGPITTVNHFPIQYFNKIYNKFTNVDGLYLTSSYDWTVKLWHNKYGTKSVNNHKKSISTAAADNNTNNGPIAIFDQMTDYVYDVKWNCNGKPGIFACCDGEGLINIWDLTKNDKHPITKAINIKDNLTNINGSSKRKNIAATTLQWTFDGKHLACGDSDGNILFYDSTKLIYKTSIDKCEKFQLKINNMLKNL